MPRTKLPARRKVELMVLGLGLGFAFAGLPGGVSAVRAATSEERIAELERRVDSLSLQLEKSQFRDIFLEPGESSYGMGPAASKIYRKDQGVSLGGYGEALYQNRSEGTDEFDFLRAVLYVGYRFDERWVFNSEIEFEHASTDQEGSTSVEFAYLDYLAHEALNARAGLLLIPMGFLNELHEPTVFLSARRPEIESRIIPSTWRENGAGFFGGVGPVSYKAYVVAGFQGEDFTAQGLRGGRQKGSESLAEDLAGVGRLDWNLAQGLLVGGSAYYGDSGQDLDPDLTTTIAEAHVDWKWRGFQFRALGVAATVDDVEALNALLAEEEEVDVSEVDSVGEELQGWYVEAGYDVLNPFKTGTHALTPYVRFEQLDTQDDVPSGATKSPANDLDVVTLGLNYKPMDQIVFKGEWQQYEDGADNDSDQVNLSMGYVF